ncbi:VaFE repeat-containing surface-anchored protein [Arcanobacterium hippocoleae]|uniref:Gram-positive cocci surface proteins LPxTG domain-containing protein n=1 Tax=Arcanobacterium hippocoleae TaxID=149017 RepID=A0ABU1T2F5_9ACTO|nr:VaFE repeat-containing surface-anchored protein [Arcanobacterium hippocoleae]MDR6939513.1 hypothetical protein [Arcanobacterium hippocoleae]
MILISRRIIAGCIAFFCACFGLLPHAIADETGYKVYRQSEDKQLGYLIEPIPGNKFSTYLGRHPDLNNSEGIPTWCVNVTQADPKAEDVLSVATLTKPTVTAPAGLQVTTAQMAYLMEKYQHSTDPNVLAGVSYLAHLNFEDEPAPGAVRALYPNTTAQENIQHLRAAVLKYASFIEAQARIYVAEAIAAAPVGYQKGTIAGAGKRHGLIHSLGVTNHAGMYLPGKSITVTLTGPAIFPETGTNTWNGTTAAEPISLAWKATGNGTVSVSSRIASGRTTLTLLETNGKSQNTITIGNRPKIDLTEITTPGPTWKVIYDFQPIGTSQVQKITDDGTFTDTFQAAADPNYADGNWLSLDRESAKDYGVEPGYVPVQYRATAYFIGAIPAAQSSKIPSDAKKIGSVVVKADGPKEIQAKFQAAEPGFVTVVWSVEKSAQGKLAELIHADWADGFGIPAETISHRHEIAIDTALSIRNTKSGTYLVDDVFITGFPRDHGIFAGNQRFQKDLPHIEQRLYFFPEGMAVLDENIGKAAQIGSVINIPANNGFFPSIGATDFRAKQSADGILTPGTYVFVTSFPGDDRVKPYTSSVTDKTEQFTVSHQPDLHTTLTYEGKKTAPASGIVELVDNICYTNLQAGKEYEIRGQLMELPSGKPLLSADEKQITAHKKFTPKTANGCSEVRFKVDAARFAGIRTVAFEKLFADGKEIAVHTDLTDKNQTIEFAPKPEEPKPEPEPDPEPEPEPKDPGDQPKLAATGAGNIIFPALFAAITIGSGGALLWIRRNRKE